MKKQHLFLLLSLSILVANLPSCHQEPSQDVVVTPPPDTIIVTPPPDTNMVDSSAFLRLDSLYGQYTGFCITYTKKLDTGVETWDTSYNDVLTISPTSQTSTQIEGCCFLYYALLPQSIDTALNISTYISSQSHSLKMRISNTDKTIETTYTYTPGFPSYKICTGKWNL
jgi:hypothetical protein